MRGSVLILPLFSSFSDSMLYKTMTERQNVVPVLNSLFKQATITGLQELVALCVAGKRQQRRELLGTEAVQINGETGANERLKEAYGAHRHTLSTSSHSKLRKESREN